MGVRIIETLPLPGGGEVDVIIGVTASLLAYRPPPGGGGPTPQTVPAPVAYWPFDGDANDDSGNNWHLTPANVSYVAGQFGQGASLAGFFSGDLRTYWGGILSGDTAGTYTIAFWGEITGASAGTVSITDGFGTAVIRFDIDRADFDVSNGVHLEAAGVGMDRFFGATSGWHHVALVVSAGSAQLYLDGVASGPPQAVFPETLYFNPMGELILQAPQSGAAKYDDMAIWSSALTPEQVLWMAVGGSPVADLIA